MSKKIYITIIAIIILVIASQFIIVQMVQNRAIKGSAAVYVAKLYDLKAATVQKNGDILEISLEDFLKSEIFAKKLLAIKLDENINPEGIFSLQDQDDIYDIVWDNVIKKAWLENMAEHNGIILTDSDLHDGSNELDTRNFLKQSEIYNFDISEEEYIERVIEPFVLETKVYIWLLENYNDFNGMQKAQFAYESLETGRDFTEVAKDFSSELTYVDSILWLKESELIEYLEPIKSLKVNNFSKIIIAPGPYGFYYNIWYLDSKTTDDDEILYGVRGIHIKAKTLDQFYNSYLSGANINKFY